MDKDKIKITFNKKQLDFLRWIYGPCAFHFQASNQKNYYSKIKEVSYFTKLELQEIRCTASHFLLSVVEDTECYLLLKKMDKKIIDYTFRRL